jgi:beta-galactosidase GanA
MPVGWNQIEPEEGRFDFSILDHWIDVARRQNIRLVPLWIRTPFAFTGWGSSLIPGIDQAGFSATTLVARLP